MVSLRKALDKCRQDKVRLSDALETAQDDRDKLTTRLQHVSDDLEKKSHLLKELRAARWVVHGTGLYKVVAPHDNVICYKSSS